MSKKRYYYVSGNTAQGFVNYLSTNIQSIDQVIVLKHVSHTLKTAVLQQLLNIFVDLNETVDVFCSPFGNEYIEGIMVRGQSLAIINDTLMTPDIKTFQEIELQDSFPVHHDGLEAVLEKADEYREKAYVKLAKALKKHDDLETIYIQEMDFSKADKITNQFIENLLQDIPKQHRTVGIYQRFFGTNTDQGPVNKVPQIIEQLSNRVYIKGRAGTGKSVFMKKVIKACKDYGFDMEQYHCSFDSNSIDMVLVPGLDLCVFDSTAPHEFSPERKGDIIIDLYEETVKSGTDEKYATEIKNITQKYKTILVEGINDLKVARFWQDKLELSYEDIDQMELKTVIERVLKDIKHTS